MGKCHFNLNKRYANKIDHNSASNGSFGKILSPTRPPDSPLSGKYPGSNGLSVF